jgi:glucose/arabinose dehydrogenase
MLQSPVQEDRWFVVERGGRIYRLRGDGSGRQLVLDIHQRVESGPMEAGLLGMAFHPRFAENGQVFLSYTEDGSPLTSIVARYHSRDGGRSIDPHSRRVVLQVKQPYRNHNGGHIVFGPDGYLYFGLGDGGAAGDPQGNGQNPTTLLGTILRLDVDSKFPYAIPDDNPFAKGGGRGEVYAWGLRNPWRWSFDRQTGDLWVGDVGQNEWEEIDRVRAGDNLGWNRWEGKHCYRRSRCSSEAVVMPRAEYSHELGCSVTGGYVYRGKAVPSLQGQYVFGDYCSGRVWALKADSPRAQPRVVLLSGKRIASFAEDRDGELYLLDLASGRIFRLING